MGVSERRQREKRARRTSIMDAAKRIFSAKGFNAATMEEIAQAAELSPATLYLYFKNKNDLYASLNLRMLEFLVKQLKELAGREDLGPREKVRGFSDALYGVYQEDPLILFNVFHLQSTQTLKELAARTTAKINQLSGQALGLIAQVFREGMEAGQFRQVHPMAMADVVWGCFSGLVLWEDNKKLFDPKKQFLKPTLDLAMETLVRGLAVE